MCWLGRSSGTASLALLPFRPLDYRLRMDRTFDTFGELPEQLQIEALREAELRIQAQLSVAAAADQRALSWGGFLITASIAVLGSGFALFLGSNKHLGLAALALIIGSSLLGAASLALWSVRPGLFCLPGNRPGLWLPHQWDCKGSERRKIIQSRIDQAVQLDKHITENAKIAQRRAFLMLASYNVATFGIFAAATCLLLYLLIGR